MHQIPMQVIKTLLSGIAAGGLTVGLFTMSQPTVLSSAANFKHEKAEYAATVVASQPLLIGEEECESESFIKTADYQADIGRAKSGKPQILLAQYCPDSKCHGDCEQCQDQYDTNLAGAEIASNSRDSEFPVEEEMPPRLLPIAIENNDYDDACVQCNEGRCRLPAYDDGQIRVAKRKLGPPPTQSNERDRELRSNTSIRTDDSRVVTASATAPSYRDAAPIKRRNQTCVVREPGESSPVMTVTLLGKETTSTIAPDEMRERKVAESSMRRLPPKPRSIIRSGTEVRPPDYPKLKITTNAKTGRTKIQVRHTSIENILEAMSRRLQIEVLRSEAVRGSLSATVVADDLVMALRSLVEPFDFVVIDHSDQLVVRHRSDRSDAPLVSVSRIGKSYPAKPSPPAQPQPAAVEMASANMIPQSMRSVTSAEASMPVASSPQMDANRIAMAMVQVLQAANQLQPGMPQTAPPSQPTEPPAPTPDVRIAEYAQDAFAAGKADYAVEILSEGVVRYRHSSLLFRLLGEAYFLRGDFPAALAATEQSLAIAKTDPLTNELMARVLLEMGQPQRADHYLLQARTLAN